MGKGQSGVFFGWSYCIRPRIDGADRCEGRQTGQVRESRRGWIKMQELMSGTGVGEWAR